MIDPKIMESLQGLPRQLTVQASLENHRLNDVEGATTAQLKRVMSEAELKDRSVAIAVGSRGIDQIAGVASAAVAYLKARGAHPFIVPAMGSHGGATAEGQREMLSSLGVTETRVGAPIRDAMDTVEIGRTDSGIKAFVARDIAGADALLIINRIKPHTDFISSQIGSGVRKMCVIGLGKAASAFECHHAVTRRGYEPVLIEVSDYVLGALPTACGLSVFGLALVEDGYHQLAHIEALWGNQIAAREPALLKLSRDWMPRLPFSKIDVLIIDQIGKNISGSGMDPNIVGRDSSGLPRSDRTLDVTTVYVRGLTPESHGNAIGLGMADVISARLVAEMDRASTYTNALSAMTPASARIPMHFSTEAECLHAALRLSGAEAANARLLRIRNTLALDQFIASENYAGEIAERNDLKVIGAAQDWEINESGQSA